MLTNETTTKLISSEIMLTLEQLLRIRINYAYNQIVVYPCLLRQHPKKTAAKIKMIAIMNVMPNTTTAIMNSSVERL